MLITAFCRPAVCVASPDFSATCCIHLAARKQTSARHSSDTLLSVAPANCKEQSPETRESAAAPSSRLQEPSESYWRDTWRHLSWGPSPGRCCCCACASYRSSDTACTLSPERMKSRKGHRYPPAVSGSTRIVGQEGHAWLLIKDFFLEYNEVKLLHVIFIHLSVYFKLYFPAWRSKWCFKALPGITLWQEITLSFVC